MWCPFFGYVYHFDQLLEEIEAEACKIKAMWGSTSKPLAHAGFNKGPQTAPRLKVYSYLSNSSS